MQSHGGRGRWSARFALVTGTMVLVVPALTSCAEDDDGGSGGGATTDPAVVDKAEELVSAAASGLVGFTGPENEITLAAMAPFEEWQGPGTSPTIVEGARLDVVICNAGTSCEEVGDKVAEIAESLGWEARVLDGQGSPEGYQEAMATSISGDPDAVVTIAIPESQIGDALAELSEADVPTVGVTAVDEGGSSGYDALVSGRTSFMGALQAAYVIADSGGTGKAVYLWVDGFPHEDAALEVSENVLAECTGCEVLEVSTRTIEQSLDPVKMADITNALLQKHGDDLEYLVLPGGVGAAYVVETLRAAGRDDVKVLSKNGEPERIGAVNKGEQAVEFGVIRGWNAYSAIDQVNRMLSGEDPVPDADQAIPATAFVQDNSPADGVIDWASYFDYPTAYEQMWAAAE